MNDVTHILSRIDSGDPSAAEQLLPLIYDELRRLAAAKLAREKPGQPLEAIAAPEPNEQLLELDEALQRFATKDPIKAQLVELRYFVGMTADEAAAVLGISPTTADRYWAYARAWLQAEVRGG